MSKLIPSTPFYLLESNISIFERENNFFAVQNKLLYQVLLLAHQGLSEKQVTDKLTSQFTEKEIKNALLSLKAKGYLFVKKRIALPNLTFISFLEQALSNNLKKSLNTISFSNNSEYSIVSFSDYDDILNIEKKGKYIPVHIDSAKVTVGPYCKSLSALKNLGILRLQKSIISYLGKKPNFFKAPDDDLNNNLLAIGRMLFVEIEKLFDLNSKKSLRTGAKIFDYADNTAYFSPCAINLEYQEKTFVVDKSFQLDPFKFSNHLDICYQNGGFRTQSGYQTIKNLMPYFGEENSFYLPPETHRIGEEDFFVHSSFSAYPMHYQPKLIDFREPGIALGKGCDYLQSKASCLAEAIERSLYASLPKKHILKASFEQIRDIAYSPTDLEQFSDCQRKNYQKTTCTSLERLAHSVPKKKYESDQIISWLPALSLISKSTRWLPFSYCQQSDKKYSPPNGEDFIYCTSNGYAGGNTPEEAIVQGFFELIERDQVAIWWLNQIIMPRIDISTFSEPYFNKIEKYFQDRRETLLVLDISFDWKISVVVAIGFDRDETKFNIGLGAHIDIRIAISRALGEMNQTKICSDEASSFLSDLKKLTKKERKYLTSYSKIKTKDDYSWPNFKKMDQVVEYIVGQTRKMGFDFLIQDYSREYIKNFFVHCVTIPGLSHMWPRLANQRIYNVPVECGHLSKRKNEVELNKVVLSQ